MKYHPLCGWIIIENLTQKWGTRRHLPTDTFIKLPSLYAFLRVKSIVWYGLLVKLYRYLPSFFDSERVLLLTYRAIVCNVCNPVARVITSQKTIVDGVTYFALIFCCGFCFSCFVVHTQPLIFAINSDLHSRNAAYAITFDIVPSILLPMYPPIFSGITKPFLSTRIAVF